MITEAFQLLGRMSCRSIAAIRLSHPAMHQGGNEGKLWRLIQVVKHKVDSLQNLDI